MVMTRRTLRAVPLALTLLCSAYAGAATPTWSTVVNNGDYVPTELCNPAAPAADACRLFNSYNQPSISAKRLVVFRARSRAGEGLGEPAHGVYTRDMAVKGPVLTVLDRDTLVPDPDNLDAEFTEPPSFPRIDINSATIATRASHPPVWEYQTGVDPITGEPITTRVGTTGIYAKLYGNLLTGASKLGAVPDFSFFEVPEQPGTYFDVFPGAPAVTNTSILVFKGNYTLPDGSRTGVYYRKLVNAEAGGSQPVVRIASSGDTLIPGTTTPFGSTAPPSAAAGKAVFTGLDNEWDPTVGGIYLTSLTTTQPVLKTLVNFGGQVPGESSEARFSVLGEGLSFDGRFVAFWGAWGSETRTLLLHCPEDGNKDLVAYCNEEYPDGFSVQVPVHQGIFVHDINTQKTVAVAKTPGDFDDMMYWNFSGRVPGTGGSEEGEEDGEFARWRSAAFVAVSGSVDGSLRDNNFHAAFKARKAAWDAGAYVNPVDGIYLRKGPLASALSALVTTGMNGTLLDPEAVDADTGEALPVTEMGLERDSFRGKSLVINAGMGNEETGWAGIYLTQVGSTSSSVIYKTWR